MRKLTKVIALLLAVVCCFAVTGCTKGSDETVYATRGETKYSTSLIRLLQMEALNDILEANKDITFKEALTATINGVSGEEYMNTYVDEQFKLIYLLDKLREDRGLSDDNTNMYYAQYYAYYSYSSNSAYFDAFGITQDDLFLLYMVSPRQNAVFSSLYGKDGEYAIPMSEKEAIMAEKCLRVRYVYMDAVDESGKALEGDARQAVIDKAKGYYDRVIAGEAIEDIIYEYAKLSNESAEKPTDITTYDNYMTRTNDSYDEALTAALADMKPGDIKLVKAADFVCVMQAYDVNENTSGASWESAAVNQLFETYADDFAAKLKEMSAELDIEYNAVAKEYFTAKQFIKDMKKYYVKAQADAIG